MVGKDKNLQEFHDSFSGLMAKDTRVYTIQSLLNMLLSGTLTEAQKVELISALEKRAEKEPEWEGAIELVGLADKPHDGFRPSYFRGTFGPNMAIEEMISSARDILTGSKDSDVGKMMAEVARLQSRPEIEKIKHDLAFYYDKYISMKEKSGIFDDVLRTPHSQFGREFIDKYNDLRVKIVSDVIDDENLIFRIARVGRWKDNKERYSDFEYKHKLTPKGDRLSGPYGDWMKDLCSEVSEFISLVDNIEPPQYVATAHISYIDRDPKQDFYLHYTLKF